MNSFAWLTSSGISPFGDLKNFLYEDQVLSTENKPDRGTNNYHSIISKNAACPKQMLEDILNPMPTYSEMFPDIFDFPNVERNLERMFAVDAEVSSLVEDHISEYDKNKIKEFEESIEFTNNAYNMDFPWLENKIKAVPFNYGVALKVLDRTMPSLERKKLDGTYLDLFHQQEAEGIIERIVLHKYVRIPHRPVFKTEQQSTTKIRPVFDCSLKTGRAYSLNEASYPGVNLTNDMFELHCCSSPINMCYWEIFAKLS